MPRKVAKQKECLRESRLLGKGGAVLAGMGT